MIKNKYSFLLILKFVTKLQDTKLDIHWRFNNVHIKPSDE